MPEIDGGDWSLIGRRFHPSKSSKSSAGAKAASGTISKAKSSMTGNAAMNLSRCACVQRPFAGRLASKPASAGGSEPVNAGGCVSCWGWRCPPSDLTATRCELVSAGLGFVEPLEKELCYRLRTPGVRLFTAVVGDGWRIRVAANPCRSASQPQRKARRSSVTKPPLPNGGLISRPRFNVSQGDKRVPQTHRTNQLRPPCSSRVQFPYSMATLYHGTSLL